jgi:cell division septum initiation protein DivIVA
MADNAYEAALQQLLQERAEIDSAIAVLQKRIGRTGTSDVTLPTNPLAKTQQGSASVDAVIYRGEFFNLSITKAAEKLIKRAGRPLKTPEILAAFEKAGYTIKSKLPRPSIYTSLNRSRDFVKVNPDTWDVAEKYPEIAALKEQQLAEKAAAKSRRNKRSAKPTEKGKTVEPIKAAAVA